MGKLVDFALEPCLLSFYLFLLVVVSLTCGSAPAWAEPDGRAVLASVGMVTGWAILAHIAARVMSRQVLAEQMPVLRAGRLLEIQLETLRWLSLPVIVVCLAGFSLAGWIREVPVFESSLLLQSLVLLAPGLTLLAATWSAEFCFGAAVGFIDGTWRSYFAALSRHFRGGPAWLIGPTMLFLGLGDLVGWIEVAAGSEDGWLDSAMVPWVTGGVAVSGGVLLVVFLPRLVQWMIRTEPMNPAIEAEIQVWLSRCGISTDRRWGTRVVRWNTDHRTINAMIAGFLPWGRMLLLTDRIIDELPRNQLMMVVMHEVAHAKRWHILIRMAAIAPAWWVSTMLGDWAVERTGDASWGPIVGGVGGLATTVVALGVIAYLTELDADRVACRLAVRAMGDDYGSLTRVFGGGESFAARSMGDALVRVTADHPASRRATWLHPSLAMRLRSLRRVPASLVAGGGSYLA